jgi:hypothetical protein
MSQPLSSVVRVATTPGQAKVFVALLQAQGIPAYVEGDSLTDEFAASRRLLNLIGTEVKVPTASLERAREILTSVESDPAELEQQALAAADGEVPIPPPPPQPPPVHSRWPLVLAISAAVVFLGLWLATLEARASERSPWFDHFEVQGTEWGIREIRLSDRRLLRSTEDRNRNGIWERVLMHGHDGRVVVTLDDENEDGVIERSVETYDGLTATWIDPDGNGRFDEGRVTDSQNRLLQTISWQPGVGYVVKQP